MKAVYLVVLLLTTVGATMADEVAPDAPSWRAGAATVKITPERPLHMAGYASRKKPAEGTEQDLFGKALAIQDSAGNSVVIVTLDLIGVIAPLRKAVETQVAEKYGVPPRSLLMNASHTHCGPAYARDDAKDYFDSLTTKLVKLVGEAIGKLKPASLAYGSARCSVAMNRRTPTETGFRNHPNPNGLVDHTVPVLSIRNEVGELQSVLFGYACHNTTMGFRYWLGDYAGFAQQYFEADNSGVTALFMMGCGADQNPYPRSELKYAKMHGRSLATSVEAALEFNQSKPLHQRHISGHIRSALGTVDLEFEPDDRPDFRYPVQVIRLGDDLMLVALGNEVVVDYSLRLKEELFRSDGPAVWVAGYSNVYDGYIPSRRVLLEGGYEAKSRPWKPELEARIIGKVHELVAETAID
ncbi:MAG: neutral/alkaline non-lysosomal ceramidase N-terminal domain-containing protein [Fuerstiella sp.]|nr:neutral/alkaline non-lysosomal ceramidase N-terminal domain-containing protein [Fuerstiella sp.]